LAAPLEANSIFILFDLSKKHEHGPFGAKTAQKIVMYLQANKPLLWFFENLEF
jgi:hypothetical protein